jgi:hypothetical protein
VWVKANTRRFIRGRSLQQNDKPLPATLGTMDVIGEVQVLGEVTNQYAGILPDQPRTAPC